MVFVEGKRPHCDYGCKVIMLDGFDLGVFGELGARRFRGGKGFAQRAQRTQRLGKGNAEMFVDYTNHRPLPIRVYSCKFVVLKFSMPRL